MQSQNLHNTASNAVVPITAHKTVGILSVALLGWMATALHAAPPGDPVKFEILAQPDYDLSWADLSESRDGLLIRGAKVGPDLLGIEFLVGRTDSNSVVISNPAVGAHLPMLIGWVDEEGFRYDEHNAAKLIHGGPMAIHAPAKRHAAMLEFYFGGFNRVGDHELHVLEGVAQISGPGDPDGIDFPHGVALNESYRITVSEWSVRHDTGSKKNAYQGPVIDSDSRFIGRTVIELRRIQ